MSEFVAYAAGLIDGEGSFGIHGRKKRTAMGRMYYASRLQVGMTKPALPVLKDLQTKWGGGLTANRASTKRWAEAWMWTLQGPELVTCLNQIIPFLRIKTEQAHTLLELEALRASLPHWGPGERPKWTDKSLAQAALLKEQMHLLNRKGPVLIAEAR